MEEIKKSEVRLSGCVLQRLTTLRRVSNSQEIHGLLPSGPTGNPCVSGPLKRLPRASSTNAAARWPQPRNACSRRKVE
ncbi:unnamed protein product [Gadus morhua 'NCC']